VTLQLDHEVVKTFFGSKLLCTVAM